MSLLGEYFEPCVMLDKITHSADGYGGMDIAWVEGAEFEVAITLDSSMESKLAQKQGVTAVYTVTTEKTINLQFHDVLRRKSDGRYSVLNLMATTRKHQEERP